MDEQDLQRLRELYFLFIKESILTETFKSDSATDFLAWLDQKIKGFDTSSVNKEIDDKIKKK